MQKNHEEIKKISSKIYTQSEKLNFPLSKKCYLVWYEYYEGKNQNLTVAVDEMIQNNKPFTHEVILDLYRQYLDHDEKEIMAQVQRETQRIIQDMLTEMLSVNDASNAYEKKLATYSKGLENTNDTNQMQNIIRSIVEDTKKVTESNQHLQKEFEKAKTQTETLSQELEKIEQVASTDALTGLSNRRIFDKEIQRLVDEYSSTKVPFSIIMLDVDHFKKFNDTYGHQIGDLVLKNVGAILKNGLKGRDIPTRYGGEEFVILLPETTLKNACIVSEHLRIRIAVRPLLDPNTNEEITKVTISSGVSEIRLDDNAETIVERADKALYLAKESGRNRTRSEEDL